jgi:hypothetical protein
MATTVIAATRNSGCTRLSNLFLLCINASQYVLFN